MPDADDLRPAPEPPRAAARRWTALLLGLLAAALAVRAAERLPPPLPASAPAELFSADRAWPTLGYLADSIGDRLAGTEGGDRAAEYLAGRLRAIPGVEVVVQEAVGTRRERRRLRRYRSTNVLARIPGGRGGAVLLSTHWDTPVGSVGASDAGVPTAVAIEVARALAAGPALDRTVILNINGAEEAGLLGADGFLEHPWARDVAAFVDLESAGPRGKATLFQVGPGAAWLARRYARSVPHPHGTVIGQDIFQSGAIPSGTDFEVYRDAGLVGLDIAFYEDGWSYHTARDRTWNVSRGSVQHMGANALALVRALSAATDAELVPDPTPAVYYDIFGIAMLAYDRRAATAIAIVVLSLALAAVASTARHGRARAVLATFAGASLAIPLAVVAAVALAAIPPLLLGRPHGWYARPWLAMAAFAPAALAAMLALHWLVARALRRLSPRDRVLAAAAGALAAMSLLYAALTLAGIGSAYLLLWWVAPAAAVQLGLAWRPATGERATALLLGAALLPGVLLTLQLLVLLLRLFAPIAGRFPLAVPFDLPIAAIVGTTTALLATIPLALVHGVRRFGAAAAASLAAAVLGIAALSLVHPYDAAHPQRIDVVHRTDPEGSRVALSGWDWPGIGRAIARVEGAALTGELARPDEAFAPAAPVPFPAPRLEIVAATALTPAATRTVTVRLPREAGVHLHRLSLPADRLAGWSLGALPSAAGDRIVVELLDAPPDGWSTTLELRGAEPVPVDLTSVRAVTTPDAARVIGRLPAWTTTTARAIVVARVRL
jgi:hypothetical protein